MTTIIFRRPQYQGGPVNLVFGEDIVRIKRWDGTQWVEGLLRRREGVIWPPILNTGLRVYRGRAFVDG